jgi:2-polyprenyl-6-methoxyphenol hydroxylase-like FAD-dependent oxidoreductase
MAPLSASPKVPVLVVGAGPVGLSAAIRLRQEGVQVRVIDELAADSKRTYPVVLHARTLRHLALMGVQAPLEWRGRAVTRLAIRTDGLPRKVLSLPGTEPIAAGAMTLPQDVLRQSLQRRLADLGVDVEWQTRLVGLQQDEKGVRVTLTRRQRFEAASNGHTAEWLNVGSETVDAELMIGADGCRSTVRQALGIELIRHGRRELYVFYDADDARAGGEAQLVFCDGLGNSVYPLQGSLSRFTFQIGVGAAHQPSRALLEQLLAARLPFHGGSSGGFEWSGSAEFHPVLAERFGEGRVWLAGDAAHVTGPLGGQSINVGLHEADDLAARMARALRDRTLESVGARYAEQRRIEWGRLFGIGPSRPDVTRAPDWVRRHLGLLLPSLPASGDDLDDLLEQLDVWTA